MRLRRRRGRGRGRGRSRRSRGCASLRGGRTAPGPLPSSASGMPGPSSATSIAIAAVLGAHRDPAPPPYLTRIVDQVAQRAAQQIGLDRGDVRARRPRTRRRWPSARNSSTTASASAARSTARTCSRRAAGAGERERVVEHRRHLLDGGDHLRALLLGLDALGADAQRGERRAQSWPIAPSIRSFSSSMADDPRAHRVEGEDRAADVGRPARLDLRRLAAALEALGGGGEVASGRPSRDRDPDHRAEHQEVDEQGRAGEARGRARDWAAASTIRPLSQLPSASWAERSSVCMRRVAPGRARARPGPAGRAAGAAARR